MHYPPVPVNVFVWATHVNALVSGFPAPTLLGQKVCASPVKLTHVKYVACPLDLKIQRTLCAMFHGHVSCVAMPKTFWHQRTVSSSLGRKDARLLCPDEQCSLSM